MNAAWLFSTVLAIVLGIVMLTLHSNPFLATPEFILAIISVFLAVFTDNDSRLNGVQ